MDIGFGPFAMAVVMTFAGSELPTLLAEIVTGIAYAVGFVFVVLGHSELFTEETSVAVVPVFTGDGSVSELGRTWSIIYVSNLIGGAIFAWLTVLVGPGIETIDPQVFGEIAHSLIKYSWSFLSSKRARGCGTRDSLPRWMFT